MPLNLRALASFGFSIAERLFQFWSYFKHTFPGLVVPRMFVNVLLDHMYPFGGFSFNNVNFVNPVQESDKLLLASTFQKSSILISCNTRRFVCRPCYINVFQWNKECFSLGTSSWTRGSLNRPEVFPGFSVIFFILILSLENLPFHHEVLCWNLRSLRLAPALERVLGIHGIYPTISLYHLQLGIWTLLPFVESMLLLHRVFEENFPMHPTFSNLPDLLSRQTHRQEHTWTKKKNTHEQHEKNTWTTQKAHMNNTKSTHEEHDKNTHERRPLNSWFLSSDSPHKLILSLWAWSAHWWAWYSSNLWDWSSRLVS